MSTFSPPVTHARPPEAAEADDYSYVWSRGGLEIPVPNWLADIAEVPLTVRLELFLVGVCVGVILAAIATLFGFYLAMG